MSPKKTENYETFRRNYLHSFIEIIARLLKDPVKPDTQLIHAYDLAIPDKMPLADIRDALDYCIQHTSSWSHYPMPLEVTEMVDQWRVARSAARPLPTDVSDDDEPVWQGPPPEEMSTARRGQRNQRHVELILDSLKDKKLSPCEIKTKFDAIADDFPEAPQTFACERCHDLGLLQVWSFLGALKTKPQYDAKGKRIGSFVVAERKPNAPVACFPYDAIVDDGQLPFSESAKPTRMVACCDCQFGQQQPHAYPVFKWIE